MKPKTDQSSGSEQAVPDVFLEIALKNTGDAMCVMKDFRMVAGNQRCLEMFGYTQEEFGGLGMENLLTPDSLELARKSYGHYLAGEDPETPETYECIRKNGDRFPAIVSAIAWPRDPRVGLAVVRDVTQLGQGLEALKRSEKLYRTVADTVPVAVILRDHMNRVVYVNDQAAEITGFTREEIAQDAVLNALTEEDRLVVLNRWNRQSPVMPREFQMRLKNDRLLWTLGASRAVFDENGDYAGMCNAFIDITDRKNTEIELMLFRQAFEQAADGMVVADMDERVIFVNDAWAEMHGHSADELVGEHLKVFHTPEQWSKEVVPLNRKLMEEGCYEGEVGHLRSDGSVFPARMSSARLDDDEGNVLGVITVARDITERKQAQLALTQANEDLARAYDLQRQFLNNVTHEVRTPLTAITGYAKMLLEGIAGPLNEEQKSMLRKTLTSSETLLGIVDDVLETARARSGATTPRPSACSPCQIVGNAVAAVQPMAAEKGIELLIECPRPGVIGIYDAEKLRAVVTNLISNAVKFTLEGSVRVIASADTAGAEIVVVDTGIGIPSDKLAAAFGEFQQLGQPRKNKPSGFGLGLSIVARMVGAIGATLIVSSERGVGTACTLYAPVLDSREIPSGNRSDGQDATRAVGIARRGNKRR